MTAISSYVCLYCVLGALCYVCVPNIDELTILTFQLELGEFAPGLEPLEFVSGECSSTSNISGISDLFISYLYIMRVALRFKNGLICTMFPSVLSVCNLLQDHMVLAHPPTPKRRIILTHNKHLYT